MEEMRRSGDVNEHAIGRVRRDERRIHHAPEAKPIQRRFILFRFRIHDGQIGHEGLRVGHRHPAGKAAAYGSPVHAREHAALAFHGRRDQRLSRGGASLPCRRSRSLGHSGRKSEMTLRIACLHNP
jgi:hypothetical protein